jgi:hypothetical protein
MMVCLPAGPGRGVRLIFFRGAGADFSDGTAGCSRCCARTCTGPTVLPNATAAALPSWLIDPEGLASEPAHDLGVVLRGWNEDLLAGHAAAVALRRCQAASRRTGADPESIWQWSYIERVSSGLFLLRLGRQAEARPFLQAADRLAGSVTPWPQTTA